MKVSGKAIIRAGNTLKSVEGEHLPEGYNEAMGILSDWRGGFITPLTEVENLVTLVAKKHHHTPIVAKRLKRAPSIIDKLRRIDTMQLKNMQDIGGCRVIVPTQKKVKKIVRELSKIGHIKLTHDYIKSPKPDGYRGIHLVASVEKTGQVKKKIEIQVRTELQHAWATSVEIIDLFTNQSIKANTGDPEWQHFFKVIGDVIGFIDEQHFINQNLECLFKEFNASSKGDRKFVTSGSEVYSLAKNLNVLDKLEAYANAIKTADEHLLQTKVDGFALLRVDIEAQSVSSKLFEENDFNHAQIDYLDAEKEAAINTNLIVALVSTDSVGGIKDAYPNYFADSSKFADCLIGTLKAYKAYNRSAPISNMLSKWLR